MRLARCQELLRLGKKASGVDTTEPAGSQENEVEHEAARRIQFFGNNVRLTRV